MFRSARSLAVLAALLLAVFLISGCASDGGSQPTQPAGGTAAAPGSTAAVPPVTGGSTATAGSDSGSEQPAAPTGSAPTSTSPTAAAESTVASTPQGVPTAEAAPSVTSLPDPSGYQWKQVVTGLNRPVDLADPGDGSGRLLVLEQTGVIRVIQNNALLPDPFLDLTDRVGTSGNERGLLGIALHPRFSENRFFYLNYTDKNGDTVVSRFTASESDPNRADPASEKQLLTQKQPFANHNGGVMAFGPDGFLYTGLGDGGSAGDPQGNGQSTDTFLGKVLRIDVDGGDPYAIPSDNPFAQGGGKPEIWAYGLRNPWRFSFDRQTGDLYIADVGQGEWEEIDYQQAGTPGGQNYGWNLREGRHEYKGQTPSGVQLVDPVAEYSHAEGGCSVTGGFVYRGQQLPDFRGVYLFADYCSGKMWGLLRGADGSFQQAELFQTGMNITSFGQDSQGELYITDQASGGIYRLAAK